MGQQLRNLEVTVYVICFMFGGLFACCWGFKVDVLTVYVCRFYVGGIEIDAPAVDVDMPMTHVRR